MRHLRSRTAAAILLLWCSACSFGAQQALPRPVAEGRVELFRIRVENHDGGAVSVLPGQGSSQIPVGRVLKAATATVPGHAASVWAKPDSVSAVAVHAVRIRIGGIRPGAEAPESVSIVPREFRYPPEDFGGPVAGDSGIYTDIPAGAAIFRDLSPYVGSPVYLEIESRLRPLPSDYTPRVGDVLVISVQRTTSPPKYIEIENWKEGAVLSVAPDGTRTEIAKVRKPVLGVGRFDGTSLTGVGAINTNHTGVITVSTAPIADTSVPEGMGQERRGGFQIVPSNHALMLPITPQTLIVEPKDQTSGGLEGTEPLFSSCLGLAWEEGKPGVSFRVQVKIDNGEWESMPTIVGKHDTAFGASALSALFTRTGTPRQVTSGVTHLRIALPEITPDFVQRVADASRREVPPEQGAVVAGRKDEALSGIVTLRATVTNPGPTEFVLFYVDGTLVGMTNTQPYTFDWDSHTVADGEHDVEVAAVDEQGARVISTKKTVYIDNSR
jgi:hypothetical protein